LFSHKLKITESGVITTDPEPYPVAYLKVKDAVLEEKEGWIRPSVGELRELLGMELLSDGLNDAGRDIMEDMGDIAVEDTADLSTETDLSSLSLRELQPRKVCVKQRGRWFSAGIDGQTEGDEDIGSELRRCFEQIKSQLSAMAQKIR
jgi:diphthine-ammonia ligase